MKLSKYLYDICLLTGLLCTGSLLLQSCGGDKKPDKAQQANAPVPVNLYEVPRQHVTYYDEYPANVVAMNQVDLHAQVQGYITGIFFKEGDRVHKGQKLYEIDRSLYMASYDQAVSGMRVAQSNLDQAQKDADRYLYLNQHDAIAKQVLDHALTTLQNAKNQLSGARQDLIKAQTNLGYSIITAPFDGTIGLSQVKLGTLVTVGGTILNTISTDNPMAVDFVVNEKQINRFIDLQHKGNKPTSDSLFTILLPNGQLYNQVGQIYTIDRGIDPLTGSIKVRLTFPNPNMALRAGMSCKLRVHNQDTTRQLVIPSKAVTEQMGEYFVFVVRDTTITPQQGDEDKKDKNAQPQSGLMAVQKKVLTGQTVGDMTIVRGGLREGDRIVTDGTQKLHAGSFVTTGAAALPGQGGKGSNSSTDNTPQGQGGAHH